MKNKINIIYLYYLLIQFLLIKDSYSYTYNEIVDICCLNSNFTDIEILNCELDIVNYIQDSSLIIRYGNCCTIPLTCKYLIGYNLELTLI